MKVLVIAVHPDDETLGCGGALLRHVTCEDEVHWLLVTSASEPDFSAEVVSKQIQQVEAVKLAYPFRALHWLKLPSTRLERLPLLNVVIAVRNVVADFRPEVVYAPNRSDVHSDHRVVFSAVQAVLKSFYMSSLGVKRALMCETISETEAAPALPENAFFPNVFVDISPFMERKLEIMNLYQTELQPEPMPRSLSAIRAQARFRGATIGVEYAESFMLMREFVG
jgi:LmbE family N-acetylglucosaminyl deacetylase